MLFSCTPDKVSPSPEASNSQPTLAGSVGDPHPRLDPTCGDSADIYLVGEDGSKEVNRCFRGPMLGYAQFPCPSGQPGWGSISIMNGLQTLVANFSLAPGWYVDQANSNFSTASSFQFDGNGIPMPSNDWSGSNVAPVVNKWQLSVQMDSIGFACFDIAVRLAALKLNLFSGVVPGSNTTLWAYNEEWNDTESRRYNGVSPFLTHWCRSYCPEQWPAAEAECATIYTGVPELPSCATIGPEVSGTTGSVYYEWSTGETTPTISVCPTTSTSYTVSVQDDMGPVAVKNIAVNVVDAACGNGNRAHKVTVCHVPPGNPSNVQNICIDWNGVPAHVERFRSPTSNPNLGHDSGCEIGTCGSNPCLQ